MICLDDLCSNHLTNMPVGFETEKFHTKNFNTAYFFWQWCVRTRCSLIMSLEC